MAENYIVKDSNKLIASDDQFSFRNEMNKDLQRIKNSIMTDGDISILGSGNYISNSVQKTIVAGSGNIVSGNANITGDNNVVSSNALIIGDRNNVTSDAIKTIVIGNDIIASKPNTIYLNNLIIPNGGTFNGNSIISYKTYLFRVYGRVYDTGWTEPSSYKLIYTNDLAPRTFSFSTSTISNPNNFRGQHTFSIECSETIFTDRTTISGNVVNAFYKLTIPGSAVYLTPSISIKAQSTNIITLTTDQFIPGSLISGADSDSVGLCYIEADLEVKVYDPTPVEPVKLSFTQSSGSFATYSGVTYSEYTDSFIFTEMPSDLILGIAKMQNTTNENNEMVLYIDQVEHRRDTFNSSADFVTIYYSVDPELTGSYEWKLESNPLYIADFDLNINNEVNYLGSNGEVSATATIQVDFLTKTTDPGNILNLTTDTASSFGFATYANGLKIFTTSTNYNVNVYKNGSLYQSFNGLSGDTTNIVTNTSGSFTLKHSVRII